MDGSKPNCNIAIIGTGALACIFGARLNSVAHVRLIGTWQAQIEALNRDRLTIHELDGSESQVALGAIHYPFQKDEEFRADIALVLVKSFQTAQAAERVRACIRPSGQVLTLQNGLGNLETLKAALPDHVVSAGVTMQGANVIRPGVVAHAGNGDTIVDDHPILSQIVNHLKAADLPVHIASETGASSIKEVLWRKLIINAAINPLTALLGKPNGFLAEDQVARELCRKTAREAAEVAVLEGAWPEAKLDEAEQLGVLAAQLTASNRSSMLQDVSRGGQTEIEAICGEIVKRANSQKIATYYNSQWLKLIRSISLNTEAKIHFTSSNLRELVRTIT